MAGRVTLGSTAEDEMLDVKLILDADGFEVTLVPSFDAILRGMRTDPPDLLILSEKLDGGSGMELCALLDGVPRRPLILYLGDKPVRGADATVAPGTSVGIADTALDLLRRGVSAATRAEPTEPAFTGDKLGARPAPASRPNGSEKKNGTAGAGKELLRAVVSEGMESLLRRVRESDYFEILGVPVEATPEEIRAAHAAGIEALRDMVRESGGRSHAEEVRSALDEAFDVLSDPRLRASYTRNRHV